MVIIIFLQQKKILKCFLAESIVTILACNIFLKKKEFYFAESVTIPLQMENHADTHKLKSELCYFLTSVLLVTVRVRLHSSTESENNDHNLEYLTQSLL